ncbi:MAG: ketopantoate reductase family protein [Gemmatimonadales bacterium]
MRIIVLGAGGVGGYYGGLLARHGHAIQLLARGPHLEAIRARGLEVRTPEGVFVAPVTATTGDRLGAADLVLLTVKSYALEEMAPLARRLAEGGALILPLLNGVGIREVLVEAGVPAPSILGGLTFISAARTAPGVVERYSPFQRVVVGEFDHSTSDRAGAVVDAFIGAGVEARLSERIEVELWQKLIFISAMAAVCGLSRTSIGAVREAPLGRTLIERAVGEAAQVARAVGVALPQDEESRVLGLILDLPPAMRPSFLADLERGGPTEVEVLNGAVARLGARHGIATPIHDAVTAVAGASASGSAPK